MEDCRGGSSEGRVRIRVRIGVRIYLVGNHSCLTFFELATGGVNFAGGLNLPS